MVMHWGLYVLWQFARFVAPSGAVHISRFDPDTEKKCCHCMPVGVTQSGTKLKNPVDRSTLHFSFSKGIRYLNTESCPEKCATIIVPNWFVVCDSMTVEGAVTTTLFHSPGSVLKDEPAVSEAISEAVSKYLKGRVDPLVFHEMVGVAGRAARVAQRAGEFVLAKYYPQVAPEGDKTLVQSLNLVMSHDAGAVPGYEHPPGTVCQGKRLVDQFKAGVTLFDFRVGKDGHLVHNWAGTDYKFGKAVDEAQALQTAVSDSERFAILLVKGKGAIDDITTAMPEGAVFTDYSSATTVGDVKKKLVVLEAETTAGAKKKLQLDMLAKLTMAVTREPTYKRMVGMYHHACEKLEKPKEDEPKEDEPKLIKASFSTTGVDQSPLCQTVKQLSAIRESMQELFNGTCPVIISVDAGIELLTNDVDEKVDIECHK